jgi:hypothetical protein
MDFVSDDFRRNFFEGEQFDAKQTGCGVMYLAEDCFLYEAELDGNDVTLFAARSVVAMLKSTYDKHGEFNNSRHYIIGVKHSVIQCLIEYIKTQPDYSPFVTYARDICQALLRFN